MDEAAQATSWITIIGTLITTAGTVAVAFITSKTHRAQKNIQRETEDNAEDNKREILGAIDEIKAGLENNSRVTVANARAMISQVYTANKDRKAISEKTWRNVLELHDAYKSVKIDGHAPNSWCDQIVDEMRNWEKL
ncbi:MAG: hypothetical protein IIY54_10690 [Ruminococcus sp.]|nr:hypothetical protein [Ruminococcus sp.]MBQ1310165.1 hypothetical protein [Ruminococcus sp.]